MWAIVLRDYAAEVQLPHRDFSIPVTATRYAMGDRLYAFTICTISAVSLSRSVDVVTFLVSDLSLPVVKGAILLVGRLAFASQGGKIFGVVLLVLWAIPPRCLVIYGHTDKRLNVVTYKCSLRMCQPKPAKMNRML